MDSWYIGTSPDHYHSHIVLMDETKAERITDTIIFHLRRIVCPTISAADTIATALAKIFQDAATRVSEENARQPRVPTDDSNSPRVNEPEDEVPDLCTPAEAQKVAEQMSKTQRVNAGLSRPMDVEYKRTAPRYAMG
jgi:uncharacterized membrane protein (UPF0182 family)